MIILRQRQFSNEDIIVAQADFLVVELLKILIIGGEDIIDNVPHWLDNAISKANTRLRFIALCITGQLLPSDFDWSDKSMRMNINFSSGFANNLDLKSLYSRDSRGNGNSRH